MFENRSKPVHFPSIFPLPSLQIHLPSSWLVFHSPLLSHRTIKLPGTDFPECAAQYPFTGIDSSWGNVLGTDTKLSSSTFSGQTLYETLTEYNVLHPPRSRNPRTINLLDTRREILMVSLLSERRRILANLRYKLFLLIGFGISERDTVEFDSQTYAKNVSLQNLCDGLHCLDLYFMVTSNLSMPESPTGMTSLRNQLFGLALISRLHTEYLSLRFPPDGLTGWCHYMYGKKNKKNQESQASCP